MNDYGPDLLRSYTDSYLREEIQAEALTRNIGAYSRFLDLAAESSGEIVNYTQMASDSEIPKETLRRYYDLLVDTLLVHRIPSFTGISGGRKAVQREKFVFFDMGVRNAVLRQHKNIFTDTQKGHLFEQWLLLQLIAFSSYHNADWRFFFYRDDLKNEVDIIVDLGASILAVEAKLATRVKHDFLDGLSIFSKYCNKPVIPILVYRGSTEQKESNVAIMPYQHFLDSLDRYLPFSSEQQG